MPPTDRAAGCLLLLYGQQLSCIAALTTGQVTRRDDTVSVRFGRHDVPVPEPLGAALLELIRNGRTHVGVESPARTRWLFPGGLPGKPITGSQLGERLRALGIYAMPGRRAAPTDLAAKLARSSPRRPAAPLTRHRRPLDARSRRRLVPLRRRLAPRTRSPDLTNSPGSRHPADEPGTIGTLPVTSTATGASLKELMARPGHSSVRAAMIYQHATRDRDRAIAQALGALVREVRQGHDDQPEDEAERPGREA